MAQDIQANPLKDKTAVAVAAEKIAAEKNNAEKIHIFGKTEPCPLIEGYNLFTGDFNRVNTTVNLVASSQWEWEQAWSVLGRDPPGQLPPNTRAIFEAVKHTTHDTAISVRPEKVEVSGNDILIDWRRSKIANDEDMNAKAGYSVLLLPEKGELKAQFNDVWPVRDKRRLDARLEESYKVFKKGSATAIQAPQQAAFRKRHQNRGRN